MKNKIIFCFGLSLISSACMAANWETIDDNLSTKLLVDNDSLLLIAQTENTVEYNSVQIAKRDLAPNFLNNFKLIAHVVDDCSNQTQSIVSLKVLDAANVLVKNTEVVYQKAQPQRVNLNSPRGKAHSYVCNMLNRYKAATPVAEERPQQQAESMVATNQTQNKTIENVIKEQGQEQMQTYRINGKDWMMLLTNEKANSYINPKEIKFNDRTKRVTFFSRIESKEDAGNGFKKGSYVISQEVADCMENKSARLYSVLYSENNKKIKEERFSGKNIAFKSFDGSTLSGKPAKYACDLKMASMAP